MNTQSGGAATCPTCGKAYASPRGVKVHHAKSHGERLEGYEHTSPETHECPSCEREFDTKNGVKIHHVRGHGESIAGEEVECAVCGTVEYRPPSRATDPGFCSPGCHAEWQEDQFSGGGNLNWSEVGKDLICKWCGVEYDNHPSRLSTTRFCSRACTDTWRSEVKSGENAPSWVGGCDGFYGHNWGDQRGKARRRDQYRCQHCGRTEPEHIEDFGTQLCVHHIRPIRLYKEESDAPVWWQEGNRLNNLITLCRGECHQVWEQMAPLRPDTPAD